MEDRKLPITVGQGAGARVVTLDLPRVHADRRHHARGPADHAAARPLRRHATGSTSTSPADLAAIVRRSAGILDVEIDDAGAEAIAARSRGTPRVANRLLKRVRDFAEVRGAGHDRRRAWRARRSTCSRSTRPASTGSTARSCARSARSSAAGPVGLSTLAVAVGEEPDTIEDVYEPYLLQQGFLMRTPRGRVATDAAFAHLGSRRRARCRSGSSEVACCADLWLA